MHRFFLLAVTTLSIVIFVSCSAPAPVSQQQDSESKKAKVRDYPSWYGNQPVVSTDSTMHAYAAALDADSAAAVSKAVKWAESGLETGISDKLEHIRSEAAREYDSEYGLDSSQFLIALRKAGSTVGQLVETVNTGAERVEGYDSYRGFAEVKVSREEMIEQIGDRLSGYEKAWNAMKESKVFREF